MDISYIHILHINIVVFSWQFHRSTFSLYKSPSSLFIYFDFLVYIYSKKTIRFFSFFLFFKENFQIKIWLHKICSTLVTVWFVVVYISTQNKSKGNQILCYMNYEKILFYILDKPIEITYISYSYLLLQY